MPRRLKRITLAVRRRWKLAWVGLITAPGLAATA